MQPGSNTGGSAPGAGGGVHGGDGSNQNNTNGSVTVWPLGYYGNGGSNPLASAAAQAISAAIDYIKRKAKVEGSEAKSGFGTGECQKMEADIAHAVGRNKATNEDLKRMMPGRDPRTIYPSPDADRTAGAMGEIEACGADNESFASAGACGTINCGNAYLAIGRGNQASCCESAPADGDYARIRIQGEAACRSTLNCTDDMDCCEPPPSAPGIMPGGPRPEPEMRRFFVNAWDEREYDASAGEGARQLSVLEHVLLAH